MSKCLEGLARFGGLGLALAALLFFGIGLAAPKSDGEGKPTVTGEIKEHALGPENAKVTVVEYASMSCPHCADFFANQFPKVKEKLIDTGRVRFVFRDYPLDPPALDAALLIQCMPEGRFLGFVGLLFQNQASWVLAPQPADALRPLARLAGLDDGSIKKCLADDGVRGAILARQLQAQQENGVRGTPAFVVNGRTYTEIVTYEDLLKAVSRAEKS